MMNNFDSLPLWLALFISALVLLGAFLTLVGTIGLIRLKTFFERVHAPTLGTSWGTASIVIASMSLFSYLGSRPVLHEFLIGVSIIVTAPVTFMLLGRAVLYRDRAEGNKNSPLLRKKPETAPESEQ